MVWQQLKKQGGRFITVVVLLALTFCFAMFQGGFVSWFIFFTVLPFLLYSFVLAIVPIRIEQVERTMSPSYVERGDAVHMNIRFRNRTRFPLVFLVVRELHLDERFYRVSMGRSSHLFLVGFKKNFEWTYTLENVKRGEYVFSELEFTITDFFGWVTRKQVIEHKEQFVVYPKTVEIPYTSLQVQYDQGAHAAKFSIAKDTTMATGVRNYQPGDKSSWIHWKSFARNGELRSKEFEDRQSQNIFLVLDRSSEQHFEEAVDLTASIMKAIVKKQGDLAFFSAGEGIFLVPTVRTAVQMEQVQWHLATVQADAEAVTPALLTQGAQLNSSILLLVTGHLSDELKTFLMNGSKYARAVICFVVTEDGVLHKENFPNSTVIFTTPQQFEHALAEVTKR